MLPLLGILFAGVQAAGSVVKHVDKTNRANQRRKFLNTAFDNEVADVKRTLARINDTTSTILAARGVGTGTTEALIMDNYANAQRDIDNLNIRRQQESQNIDDDVAASGFDMAGGLIGSALDIGGGLFGASGNDPLKKNAVNFSARSGFGNTAQKFYGQDYRRLTRKG